VRSDDDLNADTADKPVDTSRAVNRWFIITVVLSPLFYVTWCAWRASTQEQRLMDMLTDGSLIGLTPEQVRGRLRAYPGVGPGFDQPISESVLHFEVENLNTHVHGRIEFENNRVVRSGIGW
jgi:hypothetical protein